MYDFSVLKELNSNVSSRKQRVMNQLTVILIVLGVLLIILLKPEDPTFLVLLVFFSVIGFIITLFLLLLKLTKNHKKIMENSIAIVYSDQIMDYNLRNDSTYKITAGNSLKVEFELFPGFLNSNIDYVLEQIDSEEKLLKSQLSHQGSDQRTTTVFQGLYYTNSMDLEMRFLYTSFYGLGSKIANLITPTVFGDETHQLIKLPNRVDYMRGVLNFEKNSEVPSIISDLINNLHESYPKQTIRVGVINKTLHIAVDFSGKTPVISKYSKKEYNRYKDLVAFDTTFLKLVTESTANKKPS